MHELEIPLHFIIRVNRHFTEETLVHNNRQQSEVRDSTESSSNPGSRGGGGVRGD